MTFCLTTTNYTKRSRFWKNPKILGLVILLISGISRPALSEAGQKILAVQSLRVAPYEEALQGVQDACKAEIERLVLSEMQKTDLATEVRRAHPDVILAIGMGALQRVKEIHQIPIVYLMILDPEAIVNSHPNITGVGMTISPEKQLATLLKVVSGVEKVGLVYGSEKSGLLVRKATESAQKSGITLIAKEIRQPTEALSAIKSLQGGIDVFWMLPDAAVFSPEIIEFMLLFSLEHRIPILTFAEKYVEMGAFMSIGIDAHDIGLQAGEMVQMIIGSGENASQIQRADARKPVVTINLKIAKKLGITFNNEVLSEARIVE